MPNIKTLELVQRRTARFVRPDYHLMSSKSDMLRDIQLETLKDRRLTQYVTLMYRIVSKSAEVETSSVAFSITINEQEGI